MLELALLFVVVPLRVFSAARAVGRNGFLWALIGMGVFLSVEWAVMLACELIYSLMAFLSGWEEHYEELVFTQFLDLFAMCCGMASGEVIRYKLMNPDEPYFDSPPPPEQFHKSLTLE